MLSAAPKNPTKHVVLVAAVIASAIVLFALLVQLVVGLATAPVPRQVAGSFTTDRPADYGRAAERPVAPQRSG